MRNIWLGLRGLLACCCMLMLFYAPPTLADDVPSIQQVLLAEDTSAQLELDRVLAGQLVFRPIPPGLRTNLGSSASAFWLRVRLENPGDQAATRWLIVGEARLRHLSLYDYNDGHWRETKGGLAEPFSTRPVPALAQVFVLNLPPHASQEVLVRVASETIMVLEPGLWEPEQFMRQEWRLEKVVYFTSGVLVLALLFGVLLTLFAHDWAFLVYGLASLCYLLFIWGMSGLAYRELWPDSPDWALHSIGFSQALSGALLLTVHRLLLRTPQYMSRLDRVVCLLIVAFLLLALSMALSTTYYRSSIRIMVALGLILVTGSPILGFLAWRRGVSLYGYGFAAYTLPWQMLMIAHFASINWLPPLPSWFVMSGIPVSLLLSAALILTGLADQLNQSRRAHEQLQQGLRERLENLVIERTSELQQAKSLAEQALEDQKQFLGMVSHEVRSPLATIKAATELLELKLADQDSADILQRILRGAHRLTQFFDNYLTFDRMNSRQWALCETQVDLPDLLQTLCDQYAAVGSHDVRLSLAPEVLRKRWLYADMQLLSVLLDNLLENALKYSPAGSVVELSAYLGENNGLCLTVTDRGAGIAAEELDLVFNKFFRSSQVGRVIGAGLGLYLVRQIAGLHGGAVQLQSKPGQGTTAILTLPQQRWIDE
ncbi:MAG: sensor histidine kinase [Methylobacter sp.]